MADETGYDPRILKLFDGYVHGTLSRREFLDRVAKITTGSCGSGGTAKGRR